MKAGDYARAADLLEVTGATADGRKLRGLVKRRKDEAELIEHGDYTIGPMPADAMADGVLVRGERGPEVRVLIRDLARLGFYDGIMDDVFGYGTEAAVLAFQRAHGLKDDGYAGSKTLAAIAAAIAGEVSAPTPHMRVVLSLICMVFWYQITLSFWQSAVAGAVAPSTWMSAYPIYFVFEFVNIFRAARDAKIADEAE